MTLYKDSKDVVISINVFVEGATPVEIPDDTKEAMYYSRCTNCQHVFSDGTVEHYIIPPSSDPEEMSLNRLQSDVTMLTETLNTLLGVND